MLTLSERYALRKIENMGEEITRTFFKAWRCFPQSALLFLTHLPQNWLTDLVDGPAERAGHYQTSLFKLFGDDRGGQIMEQLRR